MHEGSAFWTFLRLPRDPRGSSLMGADGCLYQQIHCLAQKHRAHSSIRPLRGTASCCCYQKGEIIHSRKTNATLDIQEPSSTSGPLRCFGDHTPTTVTPAQSSSQDFSSWEPLSMINMGRRDLKGLLVLLKMLTRQCECGEAMCNM
ncbi:hypothetical protein P7K49_026999 [Saguinus oedipus]|uniref:Uncharacterized protein n=1 Tax=Saguinus oedipus TaxID=9490 RepID=A0ABQ9UES9_SAGOE|nr:hypothetical protein P7K49_026999 [Saguinus oedipus]